MRKLKTTLKFHMTYFTKDEWNKISIKLKMKWWKETDYARKPPSPQLLEEMKNGAKEENKGNN